MSTRWQKLYAEWAKPASIGPSATAAHAAERFRSAHVRRVLDLGCGVGRDAGYLAARGFAVVGVDAAPAGLAVARQRQGTTGARFLASDARALPFRAGAFPAVYCFGLLHEFVGEAADADVRAVMDEVERVLAPGGMLVLTVLAGDPEVGLPHLRLFTGTMFAAATCRLTCVEVGELDDLGCTGRPDYHVWRGTYRKPLPALPML